MDGKERKEMKRLREAKFETHSPKPAAPPPTLSHPRETEASLFALHAAPLPKR